jgi:hypothetical protein
MQRGRRNGPIAIVGRRAELDLLAARLADLALGRGGVLVVAGDPGIGKTTLLDWVSRRARTSTIIRVAGFEAERELAHAALDTLRRRLEAAGVEVPERHARVLDAATTDGPMPSPLAVGNAVLAALAACDGPLVLLVDDAQWLDAPSAQALAFALRRVSDEAVLVIVAERTEHPTAVGGQDVERLVLGGLGVDAAAQLLGDGTAVGVAARCVAATAGNPLGLVELARTLDDDQRAGRTPFPPDPQVGDRLVQAFASRVPGLPAHTRRALALAAATTEGPALDLVGALSTAGRTVRDLLPAETAGLVRVGDGRIEFVHPLMRVAVREAVGPAAMRDAHTRLAAVADVERRAWHLAAAAAGPDETAANALDDAAAIAASRGAPAVAAATWQRAVDLSADPERRVERLSRAATAWWDACDGPLALRCADEVLRASTDPATRADATTARAEAIGWTIDCRAGVQVLVDGAAEVASVHPDRAAALLIRAALQSGLAARPVDGLACAEQALRHADRDGPMSIAVRGVRALSSQRLGDRATAEADLVAGAVLADLPVELLAPALPPLQAVALALLAQERWDDAARTIGVAIRAAHHHGLDGARYFSSALLGELLLRQGRLVDALVAPAPLDAIDPVRPAPTSPFAVAVTARVEAWLGRLDEAKAHGEAAKAAGTRVGLGTLEAWAGSALGHVALIEGRVDDAIDELRRVQAVHGEVVDPGELWFEADLGEALFAAGDHTATAALATNLAARAERSSSRWGLSAARRLRGLVEHDDVALKESAMLAGELGAPLEEARSLLLLAEQFDDLDAGAGALATFERCGAVRWASRARLALRDDAGSVERASTRDAHA